VGKFAIAQLEMKPKRRRWFNYLLCLGLVISLTFCSLVLPALSKTSSPASVSPNLTELRGVWLTNVSSSVLFAPWRVNRAIQRLSQLNFNTVYPVVWNRGHTFYPSRVAQQVTGKTEDPFLNFMRGGSDVLAEIIEESHRWGLSVLPWFEYGLMVPAHSSFAKQHLNWLTQTREGKTILSDNKADADFLKDAPKQPFNLLGWLLPPISNRSFKQQVWLNPFHPAVQRFIKDLILEVVANYDIDGIQLDDHFGLPVELGYDPYTVKLYQQEHHGQKPPQNPLDSEWMRWRAAKLTNLMAQIVQAAKAVKPSVRISLSPNSYQFSYQNYLQDWKTWVQRGLVDELVLQVYRNDLASFQAELVQPAVQLARHKVPVSVGILTGTWNRPVSIERIKKQVQMVRDRGFEGVSFFYWETLWGYLTPDSPHTRRTAFQTLFAEPARRPTLAQNALKS
jgi:uncharacterized lipoprotein YddW (UPF0748 family)